MRSIPPLILILILVLGAGEAKAADISEGLADHSVTSWAEADGRPLGSVYAIAQASDGYLWIGSDAGLFRFDGWRFVHWDSLGDIPLPNAPVTAVSVSRDGSIWVGFASDAGLRHLRDGRTISPGANAQQIGFVDAIEEERGGTHWAVAQNKLYRLDEAVWRHVSVSGGEVEPFSRVVNLRPRRSGGMFVLTSDGVFQQEPSGAFTRITGPPNPSGARLSAWTWDIGEGADDSLWTTDMAAGFKQRAPGSNAWLQPQSRVMGYRLLHERRGGVWVGTIGEGLWRVLPAPPPQQWTIERITLTTGLTSNSVRSIVEDRDGNIWVGTTAGLHRLSRRKLTPISDAGLAISLEALPDGDMLVGTSNGLVAFHRSARQSLARRSMAPGVWAVQSHMDGRGVQWVGSAEGAYRLQGSQLIPVDGLQGRLVRFIASDAGGRVWFGAGNGLYRTEVGGTEVAPFEIPKEWGVTGVSTMLKDHAGRLWLVATNGGLGRLDPDGRLQRFGAQGLRDGLVVYTIFEDRARTLWLGTNAGLGRLDKGRFDFVGATQGLPGDRVGAIVDDDEGNLWLNIDSGLVRLSRAEFSRVLTDPEHRPEYRVYDASEGLGGAAIVNVRAARENNGTLWFVRGGGLTIVDPRTLDTAAPPKRRSIRIDGALADDLELPGTGDVSVPAGTRKLQIAYSALELTSPQRLRFRYRLDGFDVAWTDAGTRRQAFYTNLPPRDYTFRVEAQIDGEAAVDSATWHFTLRPMFYQTAWFYAASAGVLLIALWAAWRVRLRVVQHEFAMVLGERTRLSREIHDTLLQSLVGLTLQINKVARNVVASPAEAAQQLVRMRKQVEAYIRDARTSIWDLRSPALETRDLPTALRELGERAAAENAIAFSAVVVGQQRRVSPKVENHLLRIGQEAISNAVRHAGPGRIDLELRFDDRLLSMRVKDDGCGFAVEQIDRHNGHYGLTSMRERALEIGGEFTVSSAPGTGTEVLALVPIGAGEVRAQ